MGDYFLPLLLLLTVVTNAGELKLNGKQVIGTHNSYHLKPVEKISRMVSLVSRKAVTA